MLYHQQLRTKVADEVGKEETALSSDKVESFKLSKTSYNNIRS